MIRYIFHTALICTLLFLAGLVFWLYFPVYQGLPMNAIGDFASPVMEMELDTSTSTILFTGDVFLGRGVEWKIDEFGPEFPLLFVADWLRTADYVVGNFESAIPAVHMPTPSMGFTFSVATSALPSLKEAGFTHWSLANNHSYNHGLTGFNNTKKVLSDISTTFGHPYTISTSSVTLLPVDDEVVGVIGIHTLSGLNQSELETTLSYLNDVATIKIAYVHWGNEYETVRSSEQRALATTLAAWDIDLVIGHHPHVVQNIEMIGDTVVIYSLGNFVFDQYFNRHVQEGLVAEVEIASETVSVVLHMVSSIDSPSQPKKIIGSEREDFLQSIARSSDKKLEAQIIQGRIQVDY